MSKLTNKLIASLFMGALSTIFSHSAEAKTAEQSVDDLQLNNGHEENAMASPSPVLKNVIQMKKDGQTRLLAAHRSHRSHSSHRSSSGGYRSSGSYSTGSSSSSKKSSSSKSSSSSHVTPVRSKTTTTYPTMNNAGATEPVLMTGSKGADVHRLVRLLILKQYMLPKDSATYDYNPNVVDAVKRFQKDAGLQQDGIYDSSVRNLLVNWDVRKTVSKAK